jgi:23S rRNA (cytidine2498-2'-O)-methyltransferase
MSRKPRTVRGRNAERRGRARPHPSAAKQNASRDAVNPRRRQRDAVGAHQPKRDAVGAHQPKRDAVGAHQPKRDAVGAHQPKRDAVGARQPKRDAVGAHQPKRDAVGARQPNRDAARSHRRTRGPNRTERDGTARGPRPDQQRSPRAARGAAPQPAHFEQPAVDPGVLATCLARDEPLRVGEWLWTMREGAERDLVEELLLSGPHAMRPRKLAPALVASADAPADEDARLAVTFARQAFQVAHIARADSLAGLAAELAPAIASCLRDTPRYALQVFVPDSETGNRLAARAESLQAALTLPTHAERVDDAELRRHGGLLLQLCLLSQDTAAIGGIAADRALSLWPGGRARMRLAGDLPSRAARKLAEAFAWLGMAPGSGESCVDLGAAPGGWSWLLLDRKARVIAIDPARMDPKLMQNPRLTHVQGSAFDFAPDEPVDWLFCDMVWRPIEVAQMLGRWARRRDTRMLVANFKLPMKRKVETVAQLRAVLSASGYAGIRTRQLYHDRDEITLTAHVR